MAEKDQGIKAALDRAVTSNAEFEMLETETGEPQVLGTGIDELDRLLSEGRRGSLHMWFGRAGWASLGEAGARAERPKAPDDDKMP